MITRLIDTSEYCDICQRRVDSRCKNCSNYTHPTFTRSEYIGKTYYHGTREESEDEE